MEFELAVYRGVVDGPNAVPPSGSIAAAVAEITGAMGLGRSRELVRGEGISERTWRRLRANPAGNYSPVTRARLLAVQAALRVSPAQRDLMRGNPGCVVAAVVKVSNDVRYRRILVSGWPGWSAETPRVMLRCVLAGDVAGAASVLARVLQDGVDGPLELEDVEFVDFYPTHAAALRATFH